MNGESEDKELASVRYMKCMPPLNELDEALVCVCLQWATAGSAEEAHDVYEEG